MAVLKVAQLGHPVLRELSSPVPAERIRTPEFQRFIDDMIETMREYDGVGLAAPQVHVSSRVATIEVEANQRYPSAPEVPLLVIINPEITPAGDEEEDDWEGCLSVPGMRGKVPRLASLELSALDRDANPIKFSAQGFFARVIQHEVDHLDGRVYLDRMRDLTTLTHLQEFARYWLD
ncbi:MAG: peptide deformylase [Myxococcota bacterium]